MQKIKKYMVKHPMYNAINHFLAGLGVGSLLVHPFFDPHPVKYGLALIVIAILGHVYIFTTKGK
jgi:hypothetical protein